ncbi:ABC transporter substrate-binding protein [Pseudonocardia pini]|uniref:ABC transporter substrate-binding protein n=1 Tax=Pseudonocardia pini TaxID=2758030 RepID=UPI0015F06B80|nr:ABC transporter substrate-binding protein [Pseudonocardia pini]
MNLLSPDRQRVGRGRRRAAARLAALAAAASLALAACAGSGGSTAATPPSTDSIVVAAAALPTSFAFDAANPAGHENLEFFQNSQATLIRNPYVPDARSGQLKQDLQNFEGMLAESWTTSPDDLTYTFTLKPNVKSDAGNALTADDVLWSFQRKWKAATGITAFVWDPVITDVDSQITKVDDRTVAFTVTKPGYGFTLMSMLANDTAAIYDSTLLKQHVTAQDPWAVDWSQENKNFGFGPYRVESYTPGQSLVMAASPNFVLGEPAVKKVTYQVAADPGNRANAVKNGDAQIADQLRPADQADLADSGDVAVHSFDLTNMMTILTMVGNKAPFDDEKVRQAFAYAVPYQQIIDNVYFGRADLTKGILRPDAGGYTDAGLPDYAFDPGKAKQLLAEAGFPNGVSFTLTTSNAVPDVQDTAVQIQSYAKDAGFEITLQQQPPAQLGQSISEKSLQAYVWRDFATAQSPAYELGLFFTPGSALNYSDWNNDTFIGALNQGMEYADPFSTEAGQAWNQAEATVLNSAPFLWLARVQPLTAMNPAVSNYANRSDNVLDLAVLTVGAPPA